MGRKRRVVELVSAGVVVLRTGKSRGEVVLCGRSQPRIWALPKGTPDPGLEVEINGPLDSIEYWFVRPTDRTLCHKRVHYYLMSATGGDTSRHDHEFDEVRWFPVQEALGTMTYGNEAKLVEKGLALASE